MSQIKATPTALSDGNLDNRGNYEQLEYTRSGLILLNVKKRCDFLAVNKGSSSNTS